MADELRGPLVESFEMLADDIAVERHGDPHVAFVVLVYPDRVPAILVARPGKPPYDITALRKREDDEPGGEPFPGAELAEARDALSDTELGFMVAARGPLPLGVMLGEHLAERWSRRRMAPIERALRKADEEAARPAVCPYCHRRFTERGLPMHLAKAAVCSRRHAAAEQAVETA